ncbi:MULTISPECIES: AAA-associated domain-containing protein [Azorhizobium]|uniref:ABC-type nitrate/sulfonate/bicarbonate transport ATPase component n=1 Tax=Azorhizobium caulinodans (strain ATCC 43989 / DSM 5975 / JCM 20966 / LMG 6465 / NBRC 14845 / NCIMB 13405 / ORS 571) TaxID=438753 RepID=A8IBI6_AZOC5|nr:MULTISPECIES: nitrate/sulfonate/bicarbonate ABC transporter ATP-binding protein [Azorhizobium]TDT93529.1 NitT/TauT family transport system ATP-binding protein [Azorhizobium sp. AG788]BAF89074.1 ABC-type nitrate/sulfonate/bicarbonate transport ATPase component [Azorhizobium caulinodans ORS 571]
MLDNRSVEVNAPLVQLSHVVQSFKKSDNNRYLVLDDVSLSIKEGEIVGLLGRSGSGKSTLLRIISGLVPPYSGDVRWMGKPVNGPCQGLSMVFQTFALFPWLTVRQNVEIGLEALGVDAAERRRRAEEAIDLIGLGGFESAYPKELSGGMRQRVGFARALVVHPRLMLMDEPFSALDVLTAETLRTDIIDLWMEGRLPIKSILIVTHNIEEAVLMCDRVMIFSSNPGRVAFEMPITLPHPRDRQAPEFRALVEDIYARMTNRDAPGAAPVGGAQRHEASLSTALEPVTTNLMAGLLEELADSPYDGRADLPALADSLNMSGDDLFPIAETLQMLRFAEVTQGDLILTAEGKAFVEADVEPRKALFAKHLLAHVAIAAHIRRVLDERPTHRAPYSRFSEELEDHMSEEFAERTLRTVIAWGRYGEVFSYDEKTAQFSLIEED